MTKTTTTTIHIISQAHLDPVWLWPWQAGLDEVLATCRTMCELLDDYPDAVFTAGEAWRYQQIERVEPALLDRIRKHVKAGRWALVGGWWIQPDCNFPSGFALERQIQLGKDYFQSRFGTFPQVGYNVDSFGHAATLPGYMHAAGQRYYVMMRPQEHEMSLPGRLFRWRGFAGGPEVVTFRIAGSYATWSAEPDLGHIKRSLNDLPKGIQHTMCFVGVGDHGGGPTARLIEWVRQNRDTIPGCTLAFSSPERFFHAIAGQTKLLPLVTGELQHHAIGCYGVVRGLKTRLRLAEHRVLQAELMTATTPEQAQAAPRLEEAWQRIAFNHFHDILGGTCLPSANLQQQDQLAAAAATADDILQTTLRRAMGALPADPRQRLVLCNASDAPFDAYTEHEPWLRAGWQANHCLVDEQGREVPFQRLQTEAVNGWGARLLFKLQVPPLGLRVLRIQERPSTGTAAAAGGVSATSSGLRAPDGTELRLGADGGMLFPGKLSLALPRFDVIPDPTDNWSHSVDRYPEGPVTSPVWDAPCIMDPGPLMAACLQTGRVADSLLRAEWRLYAGEACLELRLHVNWREPRKLLKMTLVLPVPAAERSDGIPGAHLVRPNLGCERPLRDWTRLALAGKNALGIVCPDVYALDATPGRLRLTLLRSPIQTHHEPSLGTALRASVADQGEHTFRFRFACGPHVTTAWLEQQSLQLHRPLLAGDLTRGMPRHA